MHKLIALWMCLLAGAAALTIAGCSSAPARSDETAITQGSNGDEGSEADDSDMSGEDESEESPDMQE